MKVSLSWLQELVRVDVLQAHLPGEHDDAEHHGDRDQAEHEQRGGGVTGAGPGLHLEVAALHRVLEPLGALHPELSDRVHVLPNGFDPVLLERRRQFAMFGGVRFGGSTAAGGRPFHVEGLPLGTRGGVAVQHYFPADGEYEINVADMDRGVYADHALTRALHPSETEERLRVSVIRDGNPLDLLIDARSLAPVDERAGTTLIARIWR